MLALDRGNDRVRGAYVELVQDMGDAAAAERAIEVALESDPLDLGWRARHARLLLASGRVEDAEESVRQALALAPSNPALRELQGEARLAAGDGKGAAQAFRSALEVAQDPGALGDRIAALTGADDTFGAEWTLGFAEAAKIEERLQVEGDPAAVVVSRTAAYRVRADGLASRFHQVVIRVRHPEQANFIRAIAFSYSPHLERAAVAPSMKKA